MAINEDVRSELCDDTIVFNNPSFDNSIIGETIDGQIEYNTIRMISYAGEMSPVIMHTFKEVSYGE